MATHFNGIGRRHRLHATIVLDGAIAPGTFPHRKALSASIEAQLAADRRRLAAGALYGMSEHLTNKVAAFYAFIALPRPEAVQEEFLAQCTAFGLFGTVLVSPEGINGTLAGPPEGIDAFVAMLGQATADRPAIDNLELKFSSAGTQHFDRLKIRLKREIITFGQTLDETRKVGQRVAAREWNRLLEDPDVLLVDTRNGFEVAMGTFEGAVDPGLTSFSDFKTFVDTALEGARDKKIAMFCTGGIRCEKASAYMLEAGFTRGIPTRWRDFAVS